MTFSGFPELKIPFIEMTEENKKIVNLILDNIEAEGSTNIVNGIRTAFEHISS